MRDSFAKKLTELVKSDERIILLSGDIGNRMFDGLKQIAPDRFVNCGVAEANMMSVASGLALTGFRPVVYTIAPFATARCYEQIRIGVAYHEAPVLIAGTGAGLSYGALGTTHHALDDIGLFSAIGPDIDIYTPADPQQTSNQLEYFFSQNRPAYMRLGKKGEKVVTSNQEGPMSLEPQLIRNGQETVIITMGPLSAEMLAAAESAQNSDRSKNAAVVTLGSLEPLHESFFHTLYEQNFKNWIVVEEHSETGGLSSRIRNYIQKNMVSAALNVRFLNTGSSILHHIGSQDFLREKCNIGKNAVSKILLES